MGDDEQSCVYGLRHQARCLTAVSADTERNKFLVGTLSPRRENEIHLLELDDDEFEFTSSVFRHPHEVWDIAACPSKAELLFTCYNEVGMDGFSRRRAKLWQMGKDAIGPENGENETRSRKRFMVLEDVLTLTPEEPLGQWNVNKVLWCPNDAHSIITVHDSSIQHWSLQENYSSAKSISKITLPDTKPGFDHVSAVWNPHQPEVVLGHGCVVSGWDLRSTKQTFNIENAHAVMVRAIDYNPCMPHNLVTGGDDCKARFWDVRNSREPLKELSEHTHWIWSVAYNKTHDQLVLTSSSDNLVHLNSVVTISSAAYADNTNDYEAEELEKPADGLVATFDQHEDSVYAVAWSCSDIWMFASLSYDGRVVMNRVPTRERYKIMLG
ncbi:uncharacterized protein VTP21DRAFT_9615 [Calcarisporiella thermophila]|uniref:uncharacterized protein n=1 Tax=Calcarisporiella thermophila TaxID=911321 RepID=UPI0037421D8C